MADLLRFSSFALLILRCRRDNFRCFPCRPYPAQIYSACSLVIDSQFWNKFNNGKIKIADLLRFFEFLHRKCYFVGAKLQKMVMYSAQSCSVCR